MEKKRFQVLGCKAAEAAGLDVFGDDYGHVLVENMPDGSVREISWDHGEPEDNSFCRDWAFVPALLNEVSEEAASWKAKYQSAIAVIEDLPCRD